MDYFISDTHFDHRNIIKHCNRPFESVDEMNETILERWNERVGKSDTVLFLGDFTYWKGELATTWASRLNGKIVFIRGNHDRELPNSADFMYRKYGDLTFLLRHYPTRPDFYPKGWLIHGHEHNNDLNMYPFVNKEAKTINVSCEVIDYTPVSIDEIMDAISG